MINRKSHSLALVSIFAVTAVSISAAPLVSIGENATIHFVGSSSVRWDSNLFRDAQDEVEDYVVSLTPGFELKYGNGAANTNFGVLTQYEIRRYDERDELDTELFTTSAYGKYEAARLTLNGKLGFAQQQTNVGDANVLGDLIESEITTADLKGEYRLSPKFKLGAGAKYSDVNYTTFETALADNHSTTVPLDLYYEISSKLDLSAGFGYTDIQVEDTLLQNSYDTQTYFYNVGFRGDILPKLTGYFKVGYRTRERDGFGDDSSLGLDANLAWKATPKLINNFAISRNYAIAGDGSTTLTSFFKVNSSYTIATHYIAGASVGYTLREYEDNSNREDDQYNAGLTFSYVPNEFWKFVAGYSYVENDSTVGAQSYESNRIDLSASLRY